MNLFIPTDPKLFFRSDKTKDPRWGELVRKAPQQESQAGDVVLAGYPDDEGIALNGGRLGARLAPTAIRSRFYKTTATEQQTSPMRLYDMGDINTTLSLSERHAQLRSAVHKALSENKRWIGLGGGHDYGYPDGAGFLLANAKSKHKPLVINFDAHLDVRPTDRGLSSGTPFYRLLTDTELPEFDFIEVGLQRQCNSQDHIAWASEHGAKLFFYEDFMLAPEGIFKAILNGLSPYLLHPRPTYLSIDIDCFSTAYAMGASQAWPTGFSPQDLFPVLNILQNRLDIQCLGLYEVSPPLDLDERTVKLASLLIHQFLGNIPQ